MAKHVSRKLKMKKLTRQYSDEKNKAMDIPEASSRINDSIMDYPSLCKNLKYQIAEYRKIWKVALEEEYLLFYQLDVSDHPVIKVSIKVDRELKVDIFSKYGKVQETHLQSLLDSGLVLRNWYQLKNLLNYFGTENCYNHISAKYCLIQSLKYLKNCQDNISLEDDNISLKAKVEFLSSQMHALIFNKYTPSMLFLAYSIYLKSSSCYNHIQSLDFLILPKEQDLINYANNAEKTD